jgi:predicted patatin/cPLA2 family phospholipase
MLYESYYRHPDHRFLLETLEKRYLKYNQDIDALENRHTKIDVIYPPDTFKVNRLTVDEKKILEGFAQGVAAGKTYLKG